MPAIPTTLAYLPLSLEQLVSLIRQLPTQEKKLIAEILSEEQMIDISETQQQMVMERVSKYEQHPEWLIDEATALKMIEEM